jgi:nicotinic acid mononucleotide adenylyltransferase
MLIGSDSLFSFKKWKNYGEVMENCTPVVFARKAGQEEQIEAEIETLKAMGANAVYIPYKVKDISSSAFRANEHEDCVLPQQVSELVNKNNLYSENDMLRWQGTAKLLAKLMLDEKRYIHTLNVENLQ